MKQYTNSEINDNEIFGNSILYKMCADNPLHKEASIVGGKIWIIGRSYAVSP